MRWTRLIAAAAILASPLLAADGIAETIRAPVYPLYAIVSGDIEPLPEDIEVLAKRFTLVQARFSESTIEKLHEINPDFKVVHYFNSTYTSGAADAPVAEGRFRRALTMFRAAALKENLDETTTEFTLLPAQTSKPVALKPSSIEGGGSSDGRERPSTLDYVTWIRIGDEWMRIETFDPLTGRIGVTRGFDGSRPASHKSGSPVFSPVYLGSVNDTGAWPGGPGRYLRYAFDPANPAGTEWRLEQMAAAFTQGYDGFWLDICSASAFNMADSNGDAVVPWDFRSGRVYNADAYLEGQQIKVHTIQTAIHKRFGRWPVMCANNMKAPTFEPGRGGQRLMLTPTDLKPRPIDGYCIENYAGGFAARAANRVEGQGPDFHSAERWRDNQIMLMKCAQEGLAAYPMIANAGSKSILLEGLGPVRDRFETFAYASYLLCVEPAAPTRLGLPAFYQEDGRRFARLHPRYTWPVGEPAKTVPPGEIDRYRPEGRRSYLRRFTNGLVAVNPDSEDDEEIQLDQPYFDPATGVKIRSIQMRANTGKILLRNPN